MSGRLTNFGPAAGQDRGAEPEFVVSPDTVERAAVIDLDRRRCICLRRVGKHKSRVINVPYRYELLGENRPTRCAERIGNRNNLDKLIAAGR